jgi:predicted transcriptional regulator
MSELQDTESTLVTLTADIVSAQVANNTVAVADVPRLIQNVHGALAGLGANAEPVAEPAKPAVAIRSSVKPDHIVCLEDGRKLKMLKRHLMTTYQMTPTEYRAKWGLPADYPMVAPEYAERRRMLAKSIGLGRKPKAAMGTPGPASASTKPRPPRRRKPAEAAPTLPEMATELPE